jgi:hypothetical protein
MVYKIILIKLYTIIMFDEKFFVIFEKYLNKKWLELKY